MFYACVERFDVMGVRGNILSWDEEVKRPQHKHGKSKFHALDARNLYRGTAGTGPTRNTTGATGVTPLRPSSWPFLRHDL
jgi:hypothetical protein